MNLATIKVSGVQAVAAEYTSIPAGIAGATVTFEFTDPRWDSLSKTAVFRGCVTRDVIMTGNVVTVPHETVEQKGPRLMVGIYGVDSDNNLVIPTLWASLGMIRDAADPSGDPGTDPDLPIWAQLQERVEDLERNGTGGPGGDGEDGGYYAPAVTQPSSDTVEFAFSPSKPDMPAVDPVQVKLPVGQGSGGNVDLTGYATEQFVRDGYQPKGNYLTEVPEDYAKTEDIPKNVVKSVNGQTPDENGNVQISVTGNIGTDKIVLKSPDGTEWNITVSNNGIISATRADGGETVTFTIPVVNLTGDLTGISGDDYVNVICHYLDSVNAVEFTDYAEIAYQGSSSMNFTNVEDGVDKAKNYKIKLYTDEARETKSKRVFKDWFATNNFHIKANYGDCTNFMNNMMMHYLTKSYQYLTPLPREGARYTVDGFACLLYINGVFCGIRFWNLKQSDKVYAFKDENDLCYQIGLNNGSSRGDNSGAFVYGNLNEGSNAGKNFADAHAEIDYYWEDRVWDKTGNHPEVLYNTIQWVSEATDEVFKANLEQYFDKEYLINYFVMMYTCGMGDSICKNFNMLYFPDKGKWYATFWDMDFAFGCGWSRATVPYNVDVLSSTYGASRLFTKLWANFKAEIVQKYWELRRTVLTVEQVEDSINAVWGDVSAEWIAENYAAKYNGTGNFKTDGASYVKTWATNRLEYVDSVMVLTGDDVTTTAISLSATELTFDTTDNQTLVAYVEPAHSTQGVYWVSSDPDIATVVNGVVTPVSIGDCVITATSGNFSASCNVTVNVTMERCSYYQGNVTITGNSDATRVSVLFNNPVIIPANGKFAITCASGYDAYLFTPLISSTKNPAGSTSNNVLYADIITESGGAVTSDMYLYTTTWGNPSITNKSAEALTFSHIGFMVRKEDNSAVTIEEAKTAITLPE